MKGSIYKSYDELPLLLNSKIGDPAKPNAEVLLRRSRGMSEPCRLRQDEGYGACDDEKGGRPYETGCFDF